MNKHQRLVQQAFLNNEEEVISRLQSIYGESLSGITKKVKVLDSSITQLKKALDSVTDDDIGELALAVLGSKKHLTPVEAQETIKSMIQSKVYQKQYQEALRKQVGGILDTMQAKQYKTVSDYLTGCYEDGFIGTMYDLQGQGIPLCMPIDQQSMVRAVQLDSKISKGLYTRLGEDVTVLKRKITAQISRGVASGLTYREMAQQLAGETRIGYNNAVRIARTEGHRIQCQAGMDACHRAQEKGCDVLKQWDATLDDVTRSSHAMVDGELRELDKPFSNGLMFPGDPKGGAAEVINCRCALLQRASWELDEDELEELKERAEYFGLDKTASFEEYKQKYLKAAEITENDIQLPKKDDISPLSFTQNEEDAIEWYVSGEGQWINQQLRGRGDFGELSKDETQLLNALTTATSRELPGDITTLYRSVDAEAVFGNISDTDYDNLRQYLLYGEDSFGKGAYADGLKRRSETLLNQTIGKPITEKGFMSTTKSLDIAEEWGDFTGASKPIVLEFDVPKGVKGADLYKFDIEGEEQFEVLLGRNTEYEITDIFAQNGQIHLKASLKSNIALESPKSLLTNTGNSDKIGLQFFGEADIARQESSSLKRAIRKYASRISEHQKKIDNPAAYIEGWNSIDPRQQDGLIRHWQKEIRNFQASIDDRIAELTKRGDYDE